MIPAGVDIPNLAQQLQEDSVAFGNPDAVNMGAGLEPGLVSAVTHAESIDVGPVGVVVLDFTPNITADLRDIAQELLMATDLDTIIVRAPGTGAIVSETHSRSAIESAQHAFLGNPNIEEGTFYFLDQLANAGANWFLMGLFALFAIALVIALTIWGFMASRR
ncbi:DUF6676 family protein [Corynebacterium alimapuense]|uniref:Uncharacterized protein n=1 Tax=Corynebacterium alimapuense TaxID=1576874 RepID=A0A3M8K7P1_9CORY|nr:DUF6676 family protein [Corynebacterium alimapuense]RNE49170.1 hypothetical protein C5L39_01960 [Corynebacterium alimapuense]